MFCFYFAHLFVQQRSVMLARASCWFFNCFFFYNCIEVHKNMQLLLVFLVLFFHHNIIILCKCMCLYNMYVYLKKRFLKVFVQKREVHYLYNLFFNFIHSFLFNYFSFRFFQFFFSNLVKLDERARKYICMCIYIL